MKKALTSPHNLKPQGVGPKIFRNAMPFLILGIVAGIIFPSFSEFPFSFKSGFQTAGIIFIILGVAIYFTSLVQFINEFPKGKLITKGVYALSRNPLYSSWIIFIFPGLALTFNNWMFLFPAISMYISLEVMIKQEENQLQEIFGDEYLAYKSKVRRVLFIPVFR